jgi:hypothetical protein
MVGRTVNFCHTRSETIYFYPLRLTPEVQRDEYSTVGQWFPIGFGDLDVIPRLQSRALDAVPDLPNALTAQLKTANGTALYDVAENFVGPSFLIMSLAVERTPFEFWDCLHRWHRMRRRELYQQF